MEEEEVEDEKTDEKGAGVGKGVSGAERSGWFVFVCFVSVSLFCLSVMAPSPWPAEQLLRDKYKSFSEVAFRSLSSFNEKNGTNISWILNQVSNKRKKVVIKQPGKKASHEDENEGAEQGGGGSGGSAKGSGKRKTETLSAFEKAKRVLAHEAKAKAKAQEEKEKAKLALKQRLLSKTKVGTGVGIGIGVGPSPALPVKTLKRPLAKRPNSLPKRRALDTTATATAATTPRPNAQQGAEGDQGGGGRGGQDFTTIYVGNLPPDCNEEELVQLFHKFGEVSNIDLKKKMFAFVTFKDASVAKRIVDMSLIGKRPPTLREKIQLSINWSKEALPDFRAMAQPSVKERPGSPKKATPPPFPASHLKELKKTETKAAPDDGRNVVTYDDDFLL